MLRTGLDRDQTSDETLRVLSGLCEDRHIGYLTAGPLDAPILSTQVRFLELSNDLLTVALLAPPGDSLELAMGDRVRLRFVWREQLYRTTARVNQYTPQSGEDSTSPETAQLGELENLERIQRRETFRVSLLDLPPPLTSFSQPGKTEVRATGSLIELSETGGKVMLAEALIALIRVGECYDVSFEIPGETERFSLVARIERTRHATGDGVVFVGISWQLDGSWSEGKRTQTQVAKFVARHQRRARR